jgi:glutamyl-tRNA reductase
MPKSKTITSTPEPRPHLLILGASHHSTPVELRERLDFGTKKIKDSLASLIARPDISEAVVLSTCNRSELYVTCTDIAETRKSLILLLTEFHQIPAEVLEPHLYMCIDGEVAQHLYRVAAGLDSLVVGEPQIFGQVKDALAIATDQHCTGPLLNRLFHSSFAVGKRVRTETGLAEGAVSISYAAVSLAKKIFGDLTRLQVLLLGAGEMTALTALHLRSQKVREIVIASRTPAHANSLADEIKGTTIPWSTYTEALDHSDIVITATSSPKPILTKETLQNSMRTGRDQPLFIIDVGVPRNVEAAAGQIEQVFLYNIDDLTSIVRDNLSRRKTEVQRAETIVSNEVKQFSTWLQARRAIPIIMALRQRFEAIRHSELERLEPKIADLPPEARARIEEITHLLVEKLLLTPTTELKAASDQKTVLAYSDTLSRLFSLTDDSTIISLDSTSNGENKNSLSCSNPKSSVTR